MIKVNSLHIFLYSQRNWRGVWCLGHGTSRREVDDSLRCIALCLAGEFGGGILYLQRDRGVDSCWDYVSFHIPWMNMYGAMFE